jgi:poly(A) polymerase
MKYELYEVGGRVRDKLLGLQSNDVDYSVVIEHHAGWGTDVNIVFALFVQQIKSEGFKVFVETPDCFTVRAKFPKGHVHEGLDADFVLARREDGYIKGTRKPNVVLGTLMDDLLRRDFTVNAMAEDMGGNIIDPFGGQNDLMKGLIKTPTDAGVSFNDDPLRILRALRFGITKGFAYSHEVISAISLFEPSRMDVVSTERIRAELTKMFKHDTSLSLTFLSWLQRINYKLYDNILRDGLWLEPTTKK